MGVLTSKPVQVSPLSLGFPTLYTVLLANAGTSAELSALDGKGLDFKSDPLARLSPTAVPTSSNWGLSGFKPRNPCPAQCADCWRWFRCGDEMPLPGHHGHRHHQRPPGTALD